MPPGGPALQKSVYSLGFPKKVRVSRLPGAVAPKKSWNSPIKKSEFSNKKSGKKNGFRNEQKVEGYYAELFKMVILRNEISEISGFLPQKAGGALRIRVANFVPGKSGFFLYDQVLKTEKKYDSGQKMFCPKKSVKKKVFFLLAKMSWD